MHPENFEDHFSGTSEAYRRYRPGYPPALFEYLAGLAPGRSLAWDCATGNGQAASLLSAHFDRVIASDASEQQIRNSLPAERVDYRVMAAEHTDIPSRSVDLVTVAQALHWFDIEAFFDEARRVLKPGGLLAVWSYNLLRIDPAIDTIIDHLYGHTLAGYWPRERRLVESGYRDIRFPMERLRAPDFSMETEWTRPRLMGYLRTWSACRAFTRARGEDPVDAIAEALAKAWGERRTRPVSWPLSVVICRADN